jgi:hypothetical protein
MYTICIIRLYKENIKVFMNHLVLLILILFLNLFIAVSLSSKIKSIGLNVCSKPPPVLKLSNLYTYFHQHLMMYI